MEGKGTQCVLTPVYTRFLDEPQLRTVLARSPPPLYPPALQLNLGHHTGLGHVGV